MDIVGRWAAEQWRAWTVNFRLLALLRHGGAAAAWYTAFSVVSALSRTVQAIVIGVVVARIHRLAAEQASPEALVVPLAMFGAMLLARQASDGLTRLLGQMTGRRVESWVRRHVRSCLADVPGIAPLEDPNTQNDIAAVTGGALGVTISDALLGVTAAASAGLTIVASGLVLLRLHTGMAALFITVLLLGQRVLRQKSIDVLTVRVGQAGLFRRRQYVMTLNRAAAKESRVYGLSDFFLDRHDQTNREVRRALLAAFWTRQRMQNVLVAVGTLLLGVVGLFAVRGVLAGDVSVGSATTYMLAAESMLISLGATLSPSALAGDLFAALDRLRHLGRPPARSGDVVADSACAALECPAGTGGEDDGARGALVQLRNVSFRYPDSDLLVLDDIDLTIHAGESLAVVGVNGAGKTSLIKLIAGLYTPHAGDILVRGRPLTASRLRSWRAELAVVFQDFVQYPLSAASNVTLGAGRIGADQELVSQAIHSAGAAEMLDALPSGWNTVLSNEFVDGSQLSGGQWQRLALSRAIYAAKRGASLVLLDEPTANLDVRAEFEAFDRLLAHTEGVATVIVSHRFSTVRKADRIVVIDSGRVVQDGTHEYLVTTQGLYREMFEAQASRFAEGGTCPGDQAATGTSIDA